ncbi:MAG: hypothetical protein H5T61_14100 [Thermoflexales bacterium]|nr:hypothetical protein [Thermoflexales bacterium]
MRNKIVLAIGLAALLTVPLYFVIHRAVYGVGLEQYALTMLEAYQKALEAVESRNESVQAQLYAMTSVDLDRPERYDGADGRLPHWNVDLVASSGLLYHVEIREGKVVQVAEHGRALLPESESERVWTVDSPELAQQAITYGLRPYRNRWARGLNFAYPPEADRPQIIVRGGTADGWPAFLAFDASNGSLLYGAERTFTGGGLYIFSLQRQNPPGGAMELGFQRAFPGENEMADNITSVAVAHPAGESKNTTIYAGTDTRWDALFTERAQLLVSYDGGSTWNSLSGPFHTADAVLHIAVTPNGSDLFVGTTNGLVYAQKVYQNSSISWLTPESGLPAGHITGLALSPHFDEDQTVWVSVGRPTTEASLWAEPGSEGLFRSIDGGRSWERVVSAPERVVDIALSPAYIFVSTRKGVFRSVDNGISWEPLPFNGEGMIQLALSPDFPTDPTIFAANGEGAWRSENAGEEWELVTEGLAYPANAAIDIYLSPNYPRDGLVVYSAFRGGVVISYDRGRTWQPIDPTTIPGDPTPRAVAFLDNNTLLFSVYPILGWKPLYEKP